MKRIRSHIHSHFHTHKGPYKIIGALFVSCFILIATFLITRGNVPAGELSFVEHSALGKEAGSVVPASCESGYYHIDPQGSNLPWYLAGTGYNSAPSSVNSPSPQYYASAWTCSVWLINYGSYPTINIPAGTDAQAWAQCKSFYDSYAGYNRYLNSFGPANQASVSCYTPPSPPPAPSVQVYFN